MANGNRERILNASVELFNRSGTVAVTTNHIAKHLGISPGNLYFHFGNREDIVRELFQTMCAETYQAWDPKLGFTPDQFLQNSFDLGWNYRFFHREMYHLRRQDPELSRMWKRHMNRCFSLIRQNYAQWIRAGWMRPITDRWEMKALTDGVLLSSSAFLGFFESPDRPASRKILKDGIEHVGRLLKPYRI